MITKKNWTIWAFAVCVLLMLAVSDYALVKHDDRALPALALFVCLYVTAGMLRIRMDIAELREELKRRGTDKSDQE